jgi:hypothetical protein
MSDTTKPEVTVQKAPEMEMAGSCPACAGDVSIRFTGRRATSFCRKCGYLTQSIVHHHDGHVVFEQLVRAAA